MSTWIQIPELYPIDLKNIKLNQSKYSFLTNEEGGIYDDLIVTKVQKGFNIILNAACKANDFKIISKLLKNKLICLAIFTTWMLLSKYYNTPCLICGKMPLKYLLIINF